MSKIALVTGASSGIGKSAVTELLKKGFTVYAAARRIDKMKDLKLAGALPLYLDITNEKSVSDAVEYIIHQSTSIDLLVNNAGFGLLGTVEETPLQDAREQFNVNFFGLAFLTQLVIPHMRQNVKGTIINVSSIGGKIYTPYAAYYIATKFALEGFSDCLRYELKPFNIKVVVIQPGLIDSEWSEIAMANLLKSSTSGAYTESVLNYASYVDKKYNQQKGSDPSVIGKLIASVAIKKNPAPRYAAGKMAHYSLLSRKLLNDRLFDRALSLQVG
jgi:short-subunit dehydrogenase